MPLAGDDVLPDDQPKGIIAKHTRISQITGVTTTTEVGYMRIDSIPVRAGYTYEVIVPRVNLTASAVGGIGYARLRASTSGTATTSSTIIGFYRNSQPTNISSTNTNGMIGTIEITATGTLSVLLSVIALVSGTVGLHGSGTEPCWMYVKEVGTTPADTGVDI
jgi:hypothetical protein